MTPPIGLAFWRWALALILITPLAWRHLKADRAELRRRWRTIAALSATGVATFGALLYVGLQSTTALNSILLQAATPPLVLLFGALFLKDRASRGQVAAMALSLLGVLVIIAQGRPWELFHLALNRGDAIIFGAVVLYAVYLLQLRRRPDVHALSLLWATFAAAVVMLAPFMLWETAAGRVMPLTPTTLAGLAYVAIFPSFLAYLIFNRGVELIGAARSSQFMHLQPAFGAVLAVLLLGESLHGFHAVGGALIAAGIALGAWSARRAQPPAASTAASPSR